MMIHVRRMLFGEKGNVDYYYCYCFYRYYYDYLRRRSIMERRVHCSIMYRCRSREVVWELSIGSTWLWSVEVRKMKK